MVSVAVLEGFIIPEGPNSIPVVNEAVGSSTVPAPAVVGVFEDSSEACVFVTTTVLAPSLEGVVDFVGSDVSKRPPVVNPSKKSDKSRLVVSAEVVGTDENISSVVSLGVVALVVFLNI